MCVSGVGLVEEDGVRMRQLSGETASGKVGRWLTPWITRLEESLGSVHAERSNSSRERLMMGNDTESMALATVNVVYMGHLRQEQI